MKYTIWILLFIHMVTMGLCFYKMNIDIDGFMMYFYGSISLILLSIIHVNIAFYCIKKIKKNTE